mgnify:CR=1 FL=1
MFIKRIKGLSVVFTLFLSGISLFAANNDNLLRTTGTETYTTETKDATIRTEHEKRTFDKNLLDNTTTNTTAGDTIDTSDGIDLFNRGKKNETTATVTETSSTTVREDTKKRHSNLVNELMQSCLLFIDMEERSDEESLVMLQDAYSIVFHAREAEMKSEEVLAHRLISRIYIELNSPDLALMHAREANRLATESNLMGLELSYALEATARAFAALGEESKAMKYADFAKFSIDKIKDKEAKEKYINDLHSEPWFGIITW